MTLFQSLLKLVNIQASNSFKENWIGLEKSTDTDLKYKKKSNTNLNKTLCTWFFLCQKRLVSQNN